MIELGLDPDFSQDVLRQSDSIRKAAEPSNGVLGLRELLWCSIDNDNSRDVDQLTVAQVLSDVRTKILITPAY